jgi:hypothetical protein
VATRPLRQRFCPPRPGLAFLREKSAASKGCGVIGGVAAVLLLLGCGSSSSRGTAASGPSTTATRPCHTGDYGLRLSTNGATGGIVGVVQIRSAVGASCRLETQLHFSAQHADGSTVRQVDGNPALLSIRARLTPSTVVVRDWLWRNWCGTAERFTFAASAGPERASTRGISPPRCDDPRAPSRLMRLRGT